MKQEISHLTFKTLADYLLNYAWDKLHTGHWKDVALCWRVLYSLVKLLVALYHFRQLTSQLKNFTTGLAETIQDLDYSLIMGYPIFDNVASKLAFKFHEFLSRSNPEKSNNSILTVNGDPKHDNEILLMKDRPLSLLERISCPSLEKFYEIMKLGKPFIITDAMKFWPACQPNNDHYWTVENWRKYHGYRIVPIEIGSRYTDVNWGQELMTLNKFIDNFIIPSNENHQQSKGYLAQHQLFLQIPELSDDVFTPDYCMISGGCSADTTVDSNVWFGPEGTISPLHHDSDRANLLAQIRGAKYAILYPASETKFVYPHDESMLSNTSEVDVENPDWSRFPEFSKARGFHGILYANEMLYIPPRCWHYIRSLSVSFSVNFWWDVFPTLIPPWPDK